MQHLDLGRAGVDARLQAQTEALLFVVNPLSFLHQRQHAAYQRVAGSLAEIDPLGRKLAQSGIALRHGHTIVRPEALQQGPHVGGWQLRQYPALAAFLLQREGRGINTRGHRARTRRFKFLARLRRGGNLPRDRQKIARGFTFQPGRHRHTGLHLGLLIVATTITEVSVFPHQIPTAAQAGQNSQGQCAQHRLHKCFLGQQVFRLIRAGHTHAGRRARCRGSER